MKRILLSLVFFIGLFSPINIAQADSEILLRTAAEHIGGYAFN